MGKKLLITIQCKVRQFTKCVTFSIRQDVGYFS